MSTQQPTILVIGALGQVGTELTRALQDLYGTRQVIAADINSTVSAGLEAELIWLDCRDIKRLAEVVQERRINIIYHLAAILSAKAEAHPELAWDININGLRNVLEVAKDANCQVFVPSSIAAFGSSTPPEHSPQVTIQRPSTLYGISKVSAELLADYYLTRYHLDVRGLRYPGLISTSAPPGGGTTDYAIELLRAAAHQQNYTAPLRADTEFEMMYMPDAIKATLMLMQADRAALRYPNAYNVRAFSCTPASLAEAVREWQPEFQLNCDPKPDLQAIADSWPRTLDDSAAREDWGWQEDYDLMTMTQDALAVFRTQRSDTL